MHLFRCHQRAITQTNKCTNCTCPVRSGCQASVQIPIIEIAGNWKKDAATAPERLSSVTGDKALQAGTAGRHKPAGMVFTVGKGKEESGGAFSRCVQGNSKRRAWYVRTGALRLWHAASLTTCSTDFRSSFPAVKLHDSDMKNEKKDAQLPRDAFQCQT